jgi:prepilin-type N-terminal cleavage/methylation domain-containing protein
MKTLLLHRRDQGRARGRGRGGFTLIELLIVVMILGILGALIIPQFSSASDDTKKNSLASSLNALRTQIELYMLQHGDSPPALTVGPYLTNPPINQLNGKSDILIVAADVVGGDAVAGTGLGFIYNPANGKIWATNTAQDRVYNEVNPKDPNN